MFVIRIFFLHLAYFGQSPMNPPVPGPGREPAGGWAALFTTPNLTSFIFLYYYYSVPNYWFGICLCLPRKLHYGADANSPRLSPKVKAGTGTAKRHASVRLFGSRPLGLGPAEFFINGFNNH